MTGPAQERIASIRRRLRGAPMALARRGRGVLDRVRRGRVRRRWARPGAPSRLSGLLAALDALQPVPVRVVLVLGDDAVRSARAVEELLHRAEITLLVTEPVQTSGLGPRVRAVVTPTLEDRAAAMSAMRAPDLIVSRDPLGPADAAASFRLLLPFLSPGGHYLVESGVPEDPAGGGPALRPLLETLGTIAASEDREVPPEHIALAGIADAVSSVTLTGQWAVVVKRGRHRLKLRESTANAVLDRRGAGWGRVLETVGAEQVTPRAIVRHHGPSRDRYYYPTISVPELYLREYRDVTATSRQVLYDDTRYLPDTFRHPGTTLHNHALVSADAYTARLRWPPRRPPTRLTGRYFYFDTEFPGHFGHVITEVLGRSWGWLRAVERYPDIRPLVSLARDQSGIPAFQAEMFQALGIEPDSITYIPWRQAVRVESVVAASPGLVQPHYVAPALAGIWAAMGRRLETPDVPPTPRLFVSRREGMRRHCRSTPELEALFAAEGFTVVYPEDLPFATQVTMFRSAEVVAGFAGSGLFTMMFSDVSRRIAIASTSYTANNEYLIASVLGGSLDVFWGPADLAQPPGRFDGVAFQSDYDLDVAQHADALRRAING